MMKFLCPCKRKSAFSKYVEPAKIVNEPAFPTATQLSLRSTKVTNLRGDKVYALYDYLPNSSSELAFLRNDVLTIIGQFDQPWRTAVNMRTSERGLIPFNYMINDTAIAGALSAWYPVNRIEAEKKLLIPGTVTGTFLIRPSREPMTYALSCRTLCEGVVKIRHFQIRRTNECTGFYIAKEVPFANLNDLLDFYMKHPIIDDCKLTIPCTGEKPQTPFREAEISRESVQLNCIIAKGSFGEVWLGRIQSVEVAVKIPLVPTCREDFIREAKKMHAIWHAQLVQFLGVCTKPPEESVLVITEYMPNGALNKYLRTEEGRNLKQTDLLSIMDQVANGMVYLESIQFVHRDLRAANVFVAKDGRVKVGDFGQSKMLSMPSSNPIDLQTPIRWSSPEALTNEKEVTSKSDVWQYGVLGYEVFSYGGVPYEGYTTEGAIRAICSGDTLDPPEECTWRVYELMRSCWRHEPENRPNFKEVKQKMEYIIEALDGNYDPSWANCATHGC
ncbi:Tyrosine-protein kinase SPK-1 [Taenia crassiceps]|uniref:Tyrosine-protein kinase n=1 Tax=Taenia crassiceps TaxID=6207 RepID=A0ABR4Q5I3_9CEST